jgi:ABC-type lipoprotein release transport system permease subunit
VMAFSVTLRTQEIAIRLALGAQRRVVLRLILASGAKLGLSGCVIGLVGTVLATGLLRSLLFQVQPLDPPIIVVACLGLFGMAMLATAIPARRAASIDPVKAMRVD